MLISCRLLQTKHDGLRLGVSHLLKKARIHRVVLNLGLHCLGASLFYGIRRFDARCPSILWGSCAQTAELRQECSDMSVLGRLVLRSAKSISFRKQEGRSQVHLDFAELKQENGIGTLTADVIKEHFRRNVASMEVGLRRDAP